MSKALHDEPLLMPEAIDNIWLGLETDLDFKVHEARNLDGILRFESFFLPKDGEFPADEKNATRDKVLYQLAQPRNWGVTVRALFGIQLLPEQLAVLHELNNRAFPMYIASRGFGKAVSPGTPVRVKGGWTAIEDLKSGDKVYGSDGKLANVSWVSGKQSNLKMYRVTLRDGRTIDCCEDHLWKVWDKNKNRKKGKVVWSELATKDMVDNYYWERKGEKSNGREYRYALPINECLSCEEEQDLPIHPYIVGVLLGDGCVTQKTITFTTADKEIIQRVTDLLPAWYHITAIPKDNHWICTIVRSTLKTPAFYKLCEQIGIWGHNSKTKFIPEEYKLASSEQKWELVKGLMDTDGYSNGQSVIEYYTISDRLVSDFLEVARSLGLHCKDSVKEAWYQGVRYNDCHRVSIYTDKPVFHLSRKLEYLKYTVSKQGQSKYEKVFIAKIERIENGDGYCISVDNDDHTYITKDYIVTHNSFLLALYAMIKLLLSPKMKIVIVGAAFRQAKVIFEYMETIWRNAPLYRDCTDTKSGPHHDPDRWTMRVNDNIAVAVPLGDGCLTGDTLVTYEDGFGSINRYGNQSTVRDIRLWNHNGFEQSDESYYNGIKPVKQLTTRKGFRVTGTSNHKLKILKNGKVEFCALDDMKVGDTILIDRTPRWHSGNLSFDTDEAYALGAMIGDGCWTGKYLLRFTTQDEEIISRVERGVGYLFTQCKDEVHYNLHGIKEASSWRDKWGVEVSCRTKDKVLPPKILQGDQASMTACLQGLYDTDGHVQVQTTKGGIGITVGFTNTSENLVRQMQYILSHYGIISYCTSRDRDEKWNTVYELLITGKDACTFADKIGFGLRRKNSILQNAVAKKTRINSTGDIIPGIKEAVLRVISCHKGHGLPEVSYSKLKDRKNITTQTLGKVLTKFAHIKGDKGLDALRTIYNPNIYFDTITELIDKEDDHTYDLHVPVGHEYTANGFCSHNSKIRGLRANIIIADEFNSIPPDIYETVVAGFAAVSASPIDNVREAARRRAAAALGIWTRDQEDKYQQREGNQAILSGTAGYDFEHFSQYHKKYCKLIRSKGDPKRLKEIFGETDDIPDNFNPDDYSVIRIPYELIPEGFMDDKQVLRAKATMHSGIYNMEYGAVFTADSDGFFKRSLIESCVAKQTAPVQLPSGQVTFEARTRGDLARQYVYGIDPASEQDNFSIVILELWADHVRVVYSWTTNRNDFKKRLKAGLCSEHDFYSFCARQIRDLMVTFPTDNIAMDAQGGGIAVMEALHDPDKFNAQIGEQAIWPIIDPDKEADTDIEPGLHILHMCNFANYEFTSTANHGLRKDMEDKVILFPHFDPLSLEMALQEDAARVRQFGVDNPGKELVIYDSLEDCVMEIEELKDELCTIVVTRTGTGVNSRDRWDTPEVKLHTGKKGRLRKDRYSSLVMANMIARTLLRTPSPVAYSMVGGFAQDIVKGQPVKGKLYDGPEWYEKAFNSNTVFGVVRRG